MASFSQVRTYAWKTRPQATQRAETSEEFPEVSLKRGTLGLASIEGRTQGAGGWPKNIGLREETTLAIPARSVYAAFFQSLKLGAEAK